ncbi:MAG: hypothetical protein ACFFAH_16705 [Promethearchaeota archaeon]
MTLEGMAMKYYTEENSIKSLVRYYLLSEQIKELEILKNTETGKFKIFIIKIF